LSLLLAAAKTKQKSNRNVRKTTGNQRAEQRDFKNVVNAYLPRILQSNTIDLTLSPRSVGYRICIWAWSWPYYMYLQMGRGNCGRASPSTTAVTMATAEQHRKHSSQEPKDGN